MVLGVTCGLNIDLWLQIYILIILSKVIIYSNDSMDGFLIVKNSKRILCILLWTESTNVALDVDILICSNIELMSSSWFSAGNYSSFIKMQLQSE